MYNYYGSILCVRCEYVCAHLCLCVGGVKSRMARLLCREQKTTFQVWYLPPGLEQGLFTVV